MYVSLLGLGSSVVCWVFLFDGSGGPLSRLDYTQPTKVTRPGVDTPSHLYTLLSHTVFCLRAFFLEFVCLLFGLSCGPVWVLYLSVLFQGSYNYPAGAVDWAALQRVNTGAIPRCSLLDSPGRP